MEPAFDTISDDWLNLDELKKSDVKFDFLKHDKESLSFSPSEADDNSVSELNRTIHHLDGLLTSSSKVKCNAKIESVQKIKKLEADYYGVINYINKASSVLSAYIYDKNENVRLMEVNIPFNEFSLDDQKLFDVDSIFYWKIGKIKETFINKYNESKSVEKNFSELRMRRQFVKIKNQNNRIINLTKKYKKVLQGLNNQ